MVPIRRLGACGIGHVLGSCIVPAYASDNTGPEFQQFTEELAGKRDFLVALASIALTVAGPVVAVAQLYQAFKASAEGKIQAAVAKVMKPFEPSKTEKEVIKRPVMGTISERIKSWDEHATIIGGRYLSGKSVAVEEALRGVRGVFRFTIENAEWKKMMYEQLNVDNIGMFKAVMSHVREKLKDFPDNLTKYPILLLEIPRTTATPEGLTSVLKDALGRNCRDLCHGEGYGVGQDRRSGSCPLLKFTSKVKEVQT